LPSVARKKLYNYAVKLLVKDIQIRTLVSGDKTARIVLETLEPEQVGELAKLSNTIEVEVEFKNE
jgi:hypothetical protein